MKKITGLFRLIRFELPFSAGVCVVMGQMLTLGHFASVAVTLCGFFAVFFISGSILVLNDYFDVETDRINAPDRPIPSHMVTPFEALLFAIFLLLGGLLLSYRLNLTSFISAVFLLIIGFLYNRRFKKSGLPGNLLVAVSVGMTFIFGGISEGLPFNKVAWFFGIIAMLVDLGEEIAADAMDMEGDKLINSRSLAIRFGTNLALKISSAIFIIVIVLSLLPFIFSWFAKIYLIPILIMDGFIAFSTLKLLRSRVQQGRRYIRLLYLGATLGLVIFLCMCFLGV
jgi:geranylgeranylglycerol-phosphate geranylgeranyltransferase